MRDRRKLSCRCEREHPPQRTQRAQRKIKRRSQKCRNNHSTRFMRAGVSGFTALKTTAADLADAPTKNPRKVLIGVHLRKSAADFTDSGYFFARLPWSELWTLISLMRALIFATTGLGRGA